MSKTPSVLKKKSEVSTRSSRDRILLLFSLLLCLVSVIGASLVQTSNNSVKMSKVDWTTASGHHMSGYLFVPKDLPAGQTRPAIVTTHGWYNNKEMQDMNYTEFARRGYVVLAVDMFSHGNSDWIKATEVKQHATGMYDAVLYVSSLSFVDKNNIGITGHSNGARAANWAVDDDNAAKTKLIKAVYLVANDATYRDKDGKYVNKYGNRDVGIVAAKYDEFFFRARGKDGKVLSAPRDFINQANAQSFLNFGVDPAQGDQRRAGVFYTQNIDGRDAIRVIQTPKEIHPWDTMSSTVVVGALDFFASSLGQPNQISSTSHTYPVKMFFNLIGLIGIAIFVYQFSVWLLGVRIFKSLRTTSEIVPMPKLSGKSLAWFWFSLIAGQVFALVTYPLIFGWCMKHCPGSVFLQSPVFYIGIWATLVGSFTIILLLISWFALGGRKSGISLAQRGIAIGWGNFAKSILFTLLVVLATYALVFAADWFAIADFRWWVVAMKAFGPQFLGLILLAIPMLLVFYLANSVAINGFNYVQMRFRWLNLAILALFNVLNVLVMLVVQYVTFAIKGLSFTELFFNPPISNIIGIWLFPMVVFFPLAAVLSRFIFRRTRNAWLGGMISGVLIAVISVTNTITHLPS